MGDQLHYYFQNRIYKGVYFNWLDDNIDKNFGKSKPLSKYEKEHFIIKLINHTYANKTHIGCLRKELKDKWTEFIYYYTLSK